MKKRDSQNMRSCLSPQQRGNANTAKIGYKNITVSCKEFTWTEEEGPKEKYLLIITAKYFSR